MISMKRRDLCLTEADYLQFSLSIAGSGLNSPSMIRWEQAVMCLLYHTLVLHTQILCQRAEV